jgi:hypothetical protein
VSPYQFVFAPYHFFGVLSLFAHVGCAPYWRLDPATYPARTLAVGLPSLVGGVVALVICLSLAGMLQPVEVPVEFEATYVR